MVSALDVAKYILRVAYENGDLVTNLKLQKLLYYVQVRYLSKNEEAFFSDEIEAWQYGPVVRGVYEFYKSFGRNPINTEYEDTSPLTSAQKKHIRNVLAEYLSFSAYELVESIHADAPWKEIFKEGMSNIISKKSLRDFYSKRQEEQDAILATIEEE